MNEAYTAAKLDKQLDAGHAGFYQRPGQRNKIKADQAQISEIFKWFKGDFERDGGSVWEFLNKYSTVKLTNKHRH